MLRIILLITLFSLAACSYKGESIVSPAFYHWKTKVQINPTEKDIVNTLNVERLYIKFFDVDWDTKYQNAIPLAIMEWDASIDKSTEIVPTIFITNRVFQQLPIQNVPSLAKKIEDKITELLKQTQLKNIPEIQIDCDWTQSTQAPYFRLLSELKESFSSQGILLSATIRLHQIRYPQQTGIPPVDRGMLMFYNMGEVQQWEESNSILNLEKAAPYLSGLDSYNLPLDLALPLFRWGVLFREEAMIRLINGMDNTWLEDRSRFYPLGDNRYEVVQNTFVDGTFLYEGDYIRLEGVDSTQLTQAVEMLNTYAWPRHLHLSFYHLDSSVIAPFSVSFLEQLIERF